MRLEYTAASTSRLFQNMNHLILIQQLRFLTAVSIEYFDGTQIWSRKRKTYFNHVHFYDHNEVYNIVSSWHFDDQVYC